MGLRIEGNATQRSAEGGVLRSCAVGKGEVRRGPAVRRHSGQDGCGERTGLPEGDAGDEDGAGAPEGQPGGGGWTSTLSLCNDGNDRGRNSVLEKQSYKEAKG